MKIEIWHIIGFILACLMGLSFLNGFGIASAQAPTPTPLVSGEKPAVEGVPGAPDVFHPRLTRVETGISSAEAAVSDNFGYVRDDTVGYSWVNASSWTMVDFENSADDDKAGPINIGFNFKFYEYAYSQLYVSTNGILTFDSGSSYPRNEFIPQDTSPNNLIAPLWDDLAVGAPINGGSVSYASQGTSPNKYFVIKWQNVGRRYGGGDFTFQVILNENGDIRFQYKTLDGVLDSATVGIEDADGVDGLLYTHNNAAGLVANKAILFQRPDKAPRVKFLSKYQSALAVKGESTFILRVRNTGDSNDVSDTFDLNAASSVPGWSVQFYNETGVSSLSDTNSNGIVDTGPLSQSATRAILVKVKAPVNVEVGDWTNLTITARSSIVPKPQAQTHLTVAVPVPFAQALADSQAGIRLNLTSSSQIISPKVKDWFSGSTLALGQTNQGNYIFAWEKNDYKIVNLAPVLYSDIEYALVGQHGDVYRVADKLTNNSGGTDSVTDRSPGVAATGGKIAMVWVRSKYDQNKINSNVYLAILNASGTVEYGPQEITGNTGWRGETDTNIPLFISPRITAASDNKFVVAWVDQRLQTGGEISDIYYTVIDTTGATTKPKTKLTQSTPAGIRYFDPTLNALTSQKVLVAYAVYNPVGETSSIAYAVLTSLGEVSKPQAVIPSSNGWTPDAVQLKSGKILLAWTNATSNNIKYALLGGSDFSVVSGPIDLASPNLRQSDYVSVTRDRDGHGILTWMDSMWNRYLFYALVDDAGNQVTPPMVFLEGQAGDPLVLTSYAGQGNAPWSGAWETFIPFVQQ